MNFSTALRTQSLCLLFMAAHWTADAGEFVQRDRAIPPGNVVRVRDVVSVSADDAKAAQPLLDLELFPAPPTLKTIRLTRGELQQALVLHGISLRDWHWTGAEETLIANRGGVPKVIQRAAAEISRPVSPIAGSIKQPVAQPPQAAPIMVVSATHPLTRGQVIKASDVELIPADPKALVHGIFDLEEVIGMEASRNVLPGRAIEKAQLQGQRLVLRNDEVKVLSRAPGVQVEVDAHALEDGAAGDVITVLTDEGKQKLSARVIGWRRLDVFASSPRYVTESKNQNSAATPAATRE